MSRYQPYPSYKDSGVEWLGEVPKHWEIKRNRFVFNFSKGLTITKENLQDDGIPCISYGEIHSKYGFEFNPRVNALKCVSEEYLQSSKNCILHKGDFVFADTSEDYAGAGNFSYLNEEIQTFAGYHTIIARASIDINSRFCAFVLDSTAHRAQIQTVVKGTKVFSISQGILKDVSSWFPPLSEQTAIANFLDIQTSKIDTLIAKQQRLIELLSEKRQALISHAVTKGLVTNVPMKDSGVEWLGEVPEHWEVKKLKYNLRLQTQKVTIDGHSVIALENIESKSGKYVSTESSYQGEDVEFKAGDILFGKLRPYLAKVYKCNSNGVAFGDLLTYRPTKYFDSSFAFYSLLSEAFIRIVDSSTYGAKMPRASSEFINEMLLTTPPLPEQIAIAGHLDIQTTKIDTLIAKARQAIELMKERRTALISAAVTGKIDVRGMA